MKYRHGCNVNMNKQIENYKRRKYIRIPKITTRLNQGKRAFIYMFISLICLLLYINTHRHQKKMTENNAIKIYLHLSTNYLFKSINILYQIGFTSKKLLQVIELFGPMIIIKLE